MKNKKTKLLLIIFIFLFIAYFTNDFKLINIEKTAIIVAIGIDKAQNDMLEVTAQIALPQATNQSTSNSDAILYATDNTLYGALEKISLQTGWYPKLTFCNLILLGGEFVKGDFMPVIDYVLTSTRFQNSAIIAVTEQSAKQTLMSATPLDYISSFALQKILLRNLDRSSSVLVSDVREFTALSRSHSNFCYAPLITTVKTQDKQKGSSDSQTQSASKTQNPPHIKANSKNDQVIATATGEGSGSTDSGSSSQPNSNSQSSGQAVFDASKTMIFSKGKIAYTLSKEQTHCLNLLTKKVRESFIPIKINKNGKQVNALISVVSNKAKITLSTNNGAPKLTVDLTLICEKEETYTHEEIQELTKANKVSKEGLSALEKQISGDIAQLIDISLKTDCDFLQIKELLYRNNSSRYFELKDTIFSKLEYEITVNCKNYR